MSQDAMDTETSLEALHNHSAATPQAPLPGLPTAAVASAPKQQIPVGQISRPPVRYSLPPPPDEVPATDEEELAAAAEKGMFSSKDQSDNPEASGSVRPGQKGFAQRLMTKYGWSKGSGLGAQGTGILNPLYAKADKRKKKSDAEGGGFVTPTATGKILGGRRSEAGKIQDEGKFGAMSEVIKLDGMLKDIDLETEPQERGGILQEIGEECGEKYGKVERVYIASYPATDANEVGKPVFVQFVSQLSALRAVNALEGRTFNGNIISARFWPLDDFERGVFK